VVGYILPRRTRRCQSYVTRDVVEVNSQCPRQLQECEDRHVFKATLKPREEGAIDIRLRAELALSQAICHPSLAKASSKTFHRCPILSRHRWAARGRHPEALYARPTISLCAPAMEKTTVPSCEKPTTLWLRFNEHGDQDTNCPDTHF
jgi:hypothetical protein